MSELPDIIAFDKVSKSYHGEMALKEVSFSIKKGEVFGYIGPNGAGKTTSIKLMNALITDYQGGITIDGKSSPGEKQQISKVVGYMPQTIAFQDWRTVEHVLKTFGLLSGIAKTDLDKRIDEVLALVGLTEEKRKKTIHLSGGMNQKLGLAQALLHSPKIIILDEPLSGLDPGSRISLKETIKNLRDRGITIFFSSHILSDVEDIADRIGVLNKGQLVITGKLKDLKKKYLVKDNVRIEFSQFSIDPEDLLKLSLVKDYQRIEEDIFEVSLDPLIDTDGQIHKLLSTLLEKGCKIRSVQPVSPSLDELFIKIIKNQEGK